jgi:hypothetical protein
MALVTYLLGDCPGCKAQNTFGNVDVYGHYVYRGCKRCRYREHVGLPPLHKKIVYLDQFFFSHAFRGGDPRFVAAAERIERLASLQLLVAPFSSIHEDETHQWEKRDELWKFIKAAARGHEFEAAYEVEQTQLVKAFQAWLADKPAEYVVDSADAVDDDVHKWDSYLRIDVGRYMGDVELIRDLKKQSIEGLVDLFDGWRKLRTSFEEDIQAEYRVAGKSYMDFYMEFALRVAGGDYMAMFDAPIISQVVQTMLHVVSEDVPADQKLRKCAEFLFSEHFRASPYQWINAHMLATLKLLVKNGAYSNRDRALQKLSGVFYDVKHIATYSPYVDAFVMDQPMADLVSRPTIRLEERYGTKVFSLNNWDGFLAWLDQLEGEMSADHRDGLRLAYPRRAP